ncbi:succinate dehydrogenase cytochrome b subunit [Salinimicrobium oceani]|uniref:Succinate dehydrogenase cytochrome b subunit n=1 Tax=Salinimicrobium oceani TaxID=2722702 RepID=A0ABX1D230_9FLAO|nr:succinate dehydrogenase cytochrome b subunit [Salinimicrobium oceani]NJW52921.1 succinate dehydrogenase cytochrome b subunit [Salinimicrobium oceani]
MAKSALLKSSLAKKYWMAFTGLFLCLFLVGHLAGNLQLLVSGEGARDQFNEYALFMTTNPIVRVLSIVTFASILFHVIDGILLTVKNRKARPKGYVSFKPSRNTKWPSRNMGILGTVILVFIIIHLINFWGEMKFGGLDNTVYETANGERVKDLYTLTIKTFQDPELGLVWAFLYLISMIAIGLHLYHGFGSGFQSLGINHPKYNTFVRRVGVGFSIIVPLLFAIIPFYIYFVLEKI